jgi:xylulose-5-phosphate/fructose-6-phosphate phosphoketolase
MTKEIIDEPNPRALPSQLPDEVAKLSVQLDLPDLPEDELNALVAYRKAACYIAAGMFVSDDCLKLMS